MTVLLIFGLFVVIATAHNITSLDVPRYGDPHEKANLVCHYVNGLDDPPLHSVKWYRGSNEIFRYTPDQQPPTRTFNTTGGEVLPGQCNYHSCAISVSLPQTYNTRISFMCEVSTEGPRFAVVKQTKNLTVAVILKEDPVIHGVPSSVQFGEDVLLNCTTGPAMPPANIVWYIDDKQERIEPWMINNTQVSQPDKRGLRSSWRSLRMRVTSSRAAVSLRCDATQPTWPPHTRRANASLLLARSPHPFMFTASLSQPDKRGLRSSWRSLRMRVTSSRAAVSLRCDATQPTWPPHTRRANASLLLARSPHPFMFTASHASIAITELSAVMVALCLSSVHIFSKYSALSEV